MEIVFEVWKIVTIICLLALAVCIYFLNRNKQVGEFQMYIVYLAFKPEETYLKCTPDDKFSLKEYHALLNQRDKIINAVSYERMLYSIKPLKLKYWYTEEQIKFLTDGTI